MTYIDGFVIACPKANKEKFIAHARAGDSVFIDLGALRVVECWADDVPIGKVTDFRMDPAKNPMPFDGKRLIFGGFTPIVELKT